MTSQGIRALACRLAAKLFGHHEPYHGFYELNGSYEFYAGIGR